MRLPTLFLGVLLALPATGHAATVFTDSFESVGLPAGGFTIDCCSGTGAVPGWFNAGTWLSGLYNPAGSGRFVDPLAAPAGGTTYAYAQLGPFGSAGALLRDAGTVVAGATYTLAAAIGAETGDATGVVDSSGWVMRLLVDGVAVAGLAAASPGAAAPAPGGWARNTLSWTASGAEAGKGLRILLGVVDTGSSGYRVANFDEVSLTAQAPVGVPLPGGLALLAGGAAMLAGLRPRRAA